MNSQHSVCPQRSKRGSKLKDKAHILIVDDDVGMTETLSDILADLGHHVEIASDGFKAIQKVKTHSFDVILMDIKMPGINGVETYKEIKHIQPNAAVMMMTAYSVEDLVAEALKEGVYGVWYKPIEIAKIMKFIEQLKKSALILIVDDDLPTCETLMDLLKEKGYRIAQVSSGELAIEAVKEQNFDLVFIDVKMPVMNGLETYLALRQIRPNIKVIMMTAYRQEAQSLVEEASRHNACTCIYKPFDAEKLLKIIQEILTAKTKAEVQ